MEFQKENWHERFSVNTILFVEAYSYMGINIPDHYLINGDTKESVFVFPDETVFLIQ